jgi:hypothetical protein
MDNLTALCVNGLDARDILGDGVATRDGVHERGKKIKTLKKEGRSQEGE